jgi:hypothetical protein
MVRAILEGRKTQTRRVMVPVREIPDARAWREETVAGVSYAEPGYWVANIPDRYGDSQSVYTGRAHCPYGVPGDRLWVRETFATHKHIPGHIEYRASHREPAEYPFGHIYDDQTRWRPSIFMPRWASRLTLEITEVRVQRVQEISEDDCIAEGVEQWSDSANSPRWKFQCLWDSINAKRGFGWDKNPWVWAITFKQIPVSPVEA